MARLVYTMQYGKVCASIWFDDFISSNGGEKKDFKILAQFTLSRMESQLTIEQLKQFYPAPTIQEG